MHSSGDRRLSRIVIDITDNDLSAVSESTVGISQRREQEIDINDVPGLKSVREGAAQ